MRENRSLKVAERHSGRLFADLYEGNASYDATKYAHAGRPFLIHKATQGLFHVDSRHAARCQYSHAVGLPVGHYHFYDGTNPHAEAEHFWNTIEPHFLTHWPKGRGHDRQLNAHTDFAIIDIESGLNPHFGLQQFESRFRAISGRRLIGYANEAYIIEHNLHLFGDTWWVASFPTFPTGLGKRRLWAHQFSSSYRLPGIGQLCDASVIVDRNSIKYWENQ